MTQRDDFVNWQLSKVGYGYCADGPWRCTGERGCFDCSGINVGALRAVGLPTPDANTDWFANQAVNAGTLIGRNEARATRGAWAIRKITNPTFPGHGHMVTSLGDGRTIEAHSHVDGVIVGTFDGNRGFQLYCLPPRLTGFWEQPPPLPVIVPPTSTQTFSEDHVPTQVEKSVKLDGNGNGFFDLNGIKARFVRSLMVVGTVDPELVDGYRPIPRLGLTISPAGFARVVIEGGIKSGPASVRIVHD